MTTIKKRLAAASIPALAVLALTTAPAHAAASAGITAAAEDVTAVTTSLTGMGTSALAIGAAVIGAGLLGLAWRLFRKQAH